MKAEVGRANRQVFNAKISASNRKAMLRAPRASTLLEQASVGTHQWLSVETVAS